MKQFTTIINAVDCTDGQIKRWSGPRIKAESFDQAEKYCKNNLGYCKVEGEFVEEVDFDFNEWVNFN